MSHTPPALSHIMNQTNQHALVAMMHQVNALLAQMYTQHLNNTFQVNTKEDQSPVTEADLASNQFIEAALAHITPHIPVISEESVPAHDVGQWQTCWMLDPLDGTKEFIHQTGEFTVNLALIHAGKVVWAFMSIPLHDSVYFMEYTTGQLMKSTSATLPPVILQPQARTASDKTLRIAISRRAKEKELIRYTTFFNALKQQGFELALVEAGSAYKFILMIEGHIDIYPRLHPTSEWDTATGQAFLESIGGGLLSAYTFKPFTYNQRVHHLNGAFYAVMPHYHTIVAGCVATVAAELPAK